MRNIIVSTLNIKNSEQLINLEIATLSASNEAITVGLASDKFQQVPLKKDNIYIVEILEDGEKRIDVICKFNDYNFRENIKTIQKGTGEIESTVITEVNSLSFSVIQSN